MRFVLLLLLLHASACGIKAAPRPPLESTAADSPAPDARPDGGCCGDAR